MRSVNRVAKNTGILYARMGITIFISLYSTRLVLSALGVRDFGLFNLVGGTIAMLGFLNGSMAAATQRFMSYAQGEGDLKKVYRIFNMSTLLHAAIAVIVVIVLEIVGFVFFRSVLNIPLDRLSVARLVYQFMVLSTFFTIISVTYEAVITSHENMFLYAILGVVEAVLKLGIAIYITYSTVDHLVAYGFSMASLSIFLLIIRRVYCHRNYKECKISLKENFDRKLLKQMTSFASWSFLGMSSSMIANYGQGIVLNMFFGTLVNAAQGIALQVTGQLAAFSNTMLKALNPMIAKSEGAGNRELMIKATIIGSKLSFFLFTIFVIPIIIEMPYIFGFWLNNVPNYAIIFCRLLLVRTMIEQMFVTLTTSISAVGNIKRYEASVSLVNLLPLLVSYLLFKIRFPPSALYIIFIVHAILVSTLLLYFANKNCNISFSRYIVEVVLRCIAVAFTSFLVALVPFLLMPTGFYRLLITIALSATSFLIFVWWFGFASSERYKFRLTIRDYMANRGRLKMYGSK